MNKELKTAWFDAAWRCFYEAPDDFRRGLSIHQIRELFGMMYKTHPNSEAKSREEDNIRRDAARYCYLCEYQEWTPEIEEAFDCASKFIIDGAIDAAMLEALQTEAPTVAEAK